MNKKEAKDFLKYRLVTDEINSHTYERVIEAIDTLFPDEPEEKPKRWRAKEGELYWYVDSDATPNYTIESKRVIDDFRYKIGNYFQTEEEAQIYADKFKELLTSREG